MMDELVSRISEKTGLSPDQAKSAAETVLQFLQARLPAPLASVVENLVSGETGETDAGDGGGGLASKATAALGGLFGKGKPVEESQ